MTHFVERLAAEPGVRLVSRAVVKAMISDVAVRARWGVDPYPHYLAGVLAAAELAKRDGVAHICALEFGVAAGRGLLALQRHAEAVERYTGVKISVTGFDSGTGLPQLTGDYRDHPDYWQAGDFPMNGPALISRLDLRRTDLVLGPIAETLPAWTAANTVPIGFIAFDVDLYSSTRDALRVFAEARTCLRRVACYFDDVDNDVSHAWAGEQLAIAEWNAASPDVKIGTWHGLTNGKPFPDAPYWRRMRLAHDLRAIEQWGLTRQARVM